MYIYKKIALFYIFRVSNSLNIRQREKQILDKILGRKVYDNRIRPVGGNATSGKTLTNLVVPRNSMFGFLKINLGFEEEISIFFAKFFHMLGICYFCFFFVKVECALKTLKL